MGELAVIDPQEVFQNSEFFTPVPESKILSLLEDCQRIESRIESASAQIESVLGDVFFYFIDGNDAQGRDGREAEFKRLFAVEGAKKSLYAQMWQKAMDLIGVYEVMPEKRREEWRGWIRDKKTVPFTEEYVLPTLRDLLLSREQFLAERVDGVFRALSRDHVTNRPEGWSKRMIFNYAFDWCGVNHNFSGYVLDLRKLVARFIGRDEPDYHNHDAVMRLLTHNTGQWFDVDGGAVRLKGFKKGTCHVEVDPDIAARLNAILSTLYPTAIPSQFRSKPKKKVTVTRYDNLLSFAVLRWLSNFRPGYGRTDEFAYSLPYINRDEADSSRQEAQEILMMLGGVREKSTDTYRFNYRIYPILEQIVATGRVPDKRSYQFWQTPSALAERVVSLADIQEGCQVLEPSAGLGPIAEFIPAEQLHCVDVSDLHCQVLRQKGYHADCADFLEWAETTPLRFDRVVMNPPFQRGQAQAHVDAAVGLLRPGGKLVAIVPASVIQVNGSDHCHVTVGDPESNLFPDASVNVRLLIVDYPAMEQSQAA